MKSLFFLLALGLAHAAKITSYPQPEEAAPSSYGEDSSYGKEDSYGGSSSGGYGGGDEYAKQPKCSYYDETHYKEHCEEYYEKLCTTTHKESCKDVKDKNCNGVVSSKQVRKCFDVTELRCSLKEDVKLETVQLPVTVQKCRRRPGTSTISFVLLPLVPNISLHPFQSKFATPCMTPTSPARTATSASTSRTTSAATPSRPSMTAPAAGHSPSTARPPPSTLLPRPR